MIGSTVFAKALPAGLFFASKVAATPYTGRMYGRQYNWPSQVSDLAHDASWPQFVNKTTRWSTYEPPSFNEVFLPETEEDLALGVSYACPCIFLTFPIKGLSLRTDKKLKTASILVECQQDFPGQVRWPWVFPHAPRDPRCSHDQHGKL